MRIIPTQIHGAADYLVGILVVALPFFLGLVGVQRWYFVLVGAFAISYSLVTDYELGAVRILRIRFHFLLDGFFAFMMLAAPLLLELQPWVSWFSYVISILALILIMTTKTRAIGTAA